MNINYRRSKRSDNETINELFIEMIKKINRRMVEDDIEPYIELESLKKYVTTTTASAYKVMIIWISLIVIIGILYYFGIINKICLFMISVFFYVCDLICVLIWCPFRLLLKNKCCTTCRIFNWDHLMMFSPFIFIGSFFSISLVIMSLLAWIA